MWGLAKQGAMRNLGIYLGYKEKRRSALQDDVGILHDYGTGNRNDSPFLKEPPWCTLPQTLTLQRWLDERSARLGQLGYVVVLSLTHLASSLPRLQYHFFFVLQAF